LTVLGKGTSGERTVGRPEKQTLLLKILERKTIEGSGQNPITMLVLMNQIGK
jgi:hypothetical protein